MSDRELLELAAKAAEYVVDEHTEDGAWVYVAGSLPNDDGEYPIFLWRPRADDGDALRLAVTLCMRIDVISGVETEIKFWSKSDYCYLTQAHSTDSAEATRRAIVRAAAEVGSRMP